MQQFMDVNFFTMDELRNRVGNSIGFEQLADRITKERLKPQSIANEVKQRRDKIEMDYRKLYMISFDCGNDPDFYKNANAVWPRKEKLARQAHQRLAKGEAFEKVAKDMSEDKVTGANGGSLGCVRRDYFDDAVEDALHKLKSNEYSDVIKQEWGYCIVKFEKISDEDMAALLKKEMYELVQNEIGHDFDAFRAAAKIEISDGSSPAASPATAPAPGTTRK
jgi:hypothetical protein